MHGNIRVSIILPYFERPEVLAVSLNSFQALYSESQVEVVIIDDGSRPELQPFFPVGFTLPTKLVTIRNKDGINPCTPINIGVSVASGELILLSSPEIVHTNSILSAIDESGVGAKECWFFNVFALTSHALNSRLIASESHWSFMEVYNTFNSELDKDLGCNGYSWANSFGSWYSHPVYRRTDLNFLSLMRRESFSKIGGFNERYRNGSGFDDNEFRRRMISRGFQFKYKESTAAIHLMHEEVSTRSDIDIGINSNEKLYRSRIRRYLPRKSIKKEYNCEVTKTNFR